MKYWVHQAGTTSSRTFTLDEISEQLDSGQLSPRDRVCEEGKTEWVRVEDAIPAPPPPPPPPPPGDGEYGHLPPPPGAKPRGSLAVAATITAAILLVAGVVTGMYYLLGGGSRSLPSTAKYLPKDSMVVVTTYVGELYQKAEVDDLLDKGMLRAMHMPREIEDSIKDFLKNPDKLGINLGEPVYFFMQPPPKGDDNPIYGLTIPLQSRDTFISSLKELERIVDDREFSEFTDDLENDGFWQPEESHVFAINDDVLLVVWQDIWWDDSPEVDMMNIAKDLLKGEGGLADVNADFLAHQQDSFRFDVGGWVNLVPILEMAEDEGAPVGDLGILKNNFAISGGWKFEAGEIAAKLSMTYDEELLEDWGGGGVASELLDAVPDDSMMATSQSMNMDVLKKWIKSPHRKGLYEELNDELQDELGLSIDALLDAFKGDVVFALDMEMKKTEWGSRQPQPRILVGATINDSSTVKRLMGDDFEREMERGDHSIVMRDNVVFVCPDDLVSNLEKGAVSKPVTGEKRSVLADNDIGFFGDFSKLARMMAKEVRRGSDDELALDMLRSLKLITLTGEAVDGAQHYVARAKMDNDEDNSLKQIVDTVVSFANAQRRRWEDEPRDAGGDPTTGVERWPEEMEGEDNIDIEEPEMEDGFGDDEGNFDPRDHNPPPKPRRFDDSGVPDDSDTEGFSREERFSRETNRGSDAHKTPERLRPR